MNTIEEIVEKQWNQNSLLRKSLPGTIFNFENRKWQVQKVSSHTAAGWSDKHYSLKKQDLKYLSKKYLTNHLLYPVKINNNIQDRNFHYLKINLVLAIQAIEIK